MTLAVTPGYASEKRDSFRIDHSFGSPHAHHLLQSVEYYWFPQADGSTPKRPCCIDLGLPYAQISPLQGTSLVVMCCLDSLGALKVQGRDQVHVNIEPLEILRFISGGFVPMNEMCDKAGMSERQIFDRTEAVFGYFNLPSDA